MKSDDNIKWHFWYYFKDKDFKDKVIRNLFSLFVNGILPIIFSILFIYLFDRFSMENEMDLPYVIIGLISALIFSLVIPTCYDLKKYPYVWKILLYALLLVFSVIDCILCFLIQNDLVNKAVACQLIFWITVVFFIFYYLLQNINLKNSKKKGD